MFCNAALSLALLNTACISLFVHKVMAFLSLLDAKTIHENI
jgi:hypothetical protein